MMQYHGKLYGRIRGRYIQLDMTSDDVDAIERRLATAAHYASMSPALTIAGGMTRDELRQRVARLDAELRCIRANGYNGKRYNAIAAVTDGALGRLLDSGETL